MKVPDPIVGASYAQRSPRSKVEILAVDPVETPKGTVTTVTIRIEREGQQPRTVTHHFPVYLMLARKLLQDQANYTPPQPS